MDIESRVLTRLDDGVSMEHPENLTRVPGRLDKGAEGLLGTRVKVKVTRATQGGRDLLTWARHERRKRRARKAQRKARRSGRNA